MNKIKVNYDLTKYHIFYKKKHILEANNPIELKKLVKSNIKNPSKDRKVFVIDFAIDENSKLPLKLVCGQYTITTKSSLIMDSDDLSQTIVWNMENLQKIGFKNSHINKIIDAFKNNTITFNNSKVNICDIIKCS
jgi:hypothetical protein